MKIRYRFAGTIVFFGLLVLLIAGLELTLLLRNSALESHRTSLLEISSRVARNVDTLLAEKQKTALTLAATPALVEAALASNAEYDALSDDARQQRIQAENQRWIDSRHREQDAFVASYLDNPTARLLFNQHELLPGEYGEIFLTNRHGGLIASTRRLTTLAHEGKYWWQNAWNHGRGATFLDDRGLDESVGQMVLGLVVPVRRGDEVVGILKSNLLVENMLHPILSSYENEQTGHLRIVRSGGRVVYERGRAPLVDTVPALLVERMALRRSGSMTMDERRQELLTAFVPIAASLGLEGVGFGGAPQSQDHILGNTGEVWYVTVGRPMTMVLGPILDSVGGILGGGVILILVMGVVALLLARRIFRPLTLLAASARQIGSGDFSVRLPKQGEDEIADLAEAFNRMARDLRHTTTRRDALQKEMTQRQEAEQAFQQLSRRLEDLVNTVEGILWEVDVATFRFTFVSRQAEQILGYPLSDWYEKKDFWQEAIHPDDREWAIRFCLEQTCQLANHTFEYRMIARDGRPVWLRDVVVVVAEAGKPVTLRGLMIDITGLKQTHNALSTTQFSVDNAPDAVAWINQDAEFVYVNDAHCASLGYTRQELLSMRVWDVDPNFPKEAWSDHWAELEQKKEMRFETLNRTKDGRVFPVEIHLRFQIFDGRKINCAFIRDISQRKKSDDEKLVLEKQLRQAQKLEAIGTLAGGIAHDFNNILGIILGYVELAHEQSDFGGKARHFLEEAERAGMRARDLVLQLLTFSRRSEQALQPVRLSSLINEVMKFLRSTVPTTIAFHTEVLDGDGMVLSDATHIHQILMNLCTNAIYAMGESGRLTVRQERVTLSHDQSIPLGLVPGSYVRIGVQDTGEGIPPQVMEHIFDPFFTTKPFGKGTGLGLSVVHGIVTGCKGAIQVESTVGEGTLFQVYLPRIEADRVELPPAAETIPTGEGCVLLVDDEPKLLEVGAVLLRELGYQVVALDHPQQALERFLAYPDDFVAVVTDLTMPIMNGVTLGRLILERSPALPVILCSGHHDLIPPDKVREMGFRGSLQKPFTRRDLAVTLQRAIHVRAA